MQTSYLRQDYYNYYKHTKYELVSEWDSASVWYNQGSYCTRAHTHTLHLGNPQPWHQLYLFGERLGEDRHQVLQSSFSIKLACVLWRTTLFRGLRTNVNTHIKNCKAFVWLADCRCNASITSVASMARSISSSQTLDQNSIPCKATSSMSLFMASIVIWTQRSWWDTDIHPFSAAEEMMLSLNHNACNLSSAVILV